VIAVTIPNFVEIYIIYGFQELFFHTRSMFMRPWSFLFNAILFLLISLAIFSCTSIPTNPYDQKNTKIILFGKSTIQTANETSVVDSVGNPISVGFTGNLPKYLDSVQLKIVLSGARDSVIKTYTDLTQLKSSDTTWDALVFSDTGTKTIIGTAFISGIASTFSDSITIIVRGKPLNHKPSLVFTGPISIVAGQQSILTVTAVDSDKTQQDTIVLAQGPSGSVFSSGIFNWTPPATFSGTDSAIFIVHDNGYPVMYDTAKVVFTVTSSSTNPTLWVHSTLNQVGSPGNALTMTLLDKCSFPTGDVLTFTLLPGLPGTDSIANASIAPTYTFTPGPADTGVFHPQIVAKDSRGISDTLTIALRISVSPSADTLPPVITRIYPLLDSAKVSSNALAVTVRCTDPSGVAGVRCLMNADTFPVTSLDSGKYSAAISGLGQGNINSILFVAVDASPRANTDTLIMHVKYDSTIADNTPPIIALLGPSKDTVIGSDSSVVRVKCTDASGIASVVYAVGTQNFTATRSAPTDSIFSATVKGLSTAANPTVTITATDASTAANKGTKTVALSFAIAAKITTALASTTSVNTGSSTTLTIVAIGTPTPIYQWYFNGTVITTNSQSASYVKSWTAADAGTYKVIISNVAGQDSTSTVLSVNTKASITTPLEATTAVNPGSTTALSIVAGGTPSPTYQWYFNGTAISTNGTSASYSKTWAAADAGVYKVIASNTAGKDSSSTTLSVNVKAAITTGLTLTTTVNPGSVTPLTVTASGTPAPTYQWYFNGTAISGATSASYSKTWATADAGTYKVIASNSAGNDSSSTTLSVNAKATITTPLASTTAVNPGSSTGLTIIAGGTPAPTYQWYFNGTAISTNGTSASYSKTWASTDAGTYKIVVSNAVGKDSSSTVLSVNVKAAITAGLAASTSVISGSSTALSITATGTPTPTYQWYFNGTSISSATSASYSKTWASTDAGTYKVIASNSAGKDSSSTTLTVGAKPTITTILAATTSVASGSSTALTIVATGIPAPSYQWYFNGTAINTNGTSTSYSKTWAFTDAGTYKVVATNSAGKDSSTTTLKVLGWQRIVQSMYDPQGSNPYAVINNTGDIYMAYQVPSPSGLVVDKLAANATQWVHTSSGSIASYNNFGGGYDIALSGSKTYPYVGYVNSAEHTGGVVQYNGASWVTLTSMPCGSISGGSVSFDAFALDGNNNPVVSYHDDAYYFAGLCDNNVLQATSQVSLDYAQAMSLQFNTANSLFWAHNKSVFQWNPNNYNFNQQYRTNIPDAVGSADTTCNQVVIRFDNNYKCYAMRTTGSGYPQVWQETNTSWQAFGNGPLKNGSVSNIKLIFGDDQKFYASYYDPDSTAIMIRQYDLSSNKWLPFPATTNGKLSVPQFGQGYAFLIQSGTIYIVLDYGSGISTWSYKQ
jgi:Immunoglobulin I-set domain/Immunoglobulin domain